MQLHLKLGREEAGLDLVRLRGRLVEAFGPPTATLRRDPVTQLVRALISARTQDAVTDAVLARLRQAFRPWGRLAEARAEEVEPLIAPVTHAERKAPQLIQTLRRVARRAGALSLDFLGAWPVDEAMAWLMELPGVGQKAAASVLNLSTLQRRVMVVDTHVWRVALRMGLAAPDADANEVRLTLMDHAPDAWEAEDFTSLHKLMKRLGQLHCHAAMPECPACTLRPDCPEGRKRFGAGEPPAPRPAAPSAANENASRGGLDAYLRRRIAHIEARGRLGWATAARPAPMGAGPLDAAVGGRGLPPGAHQASPAHPQDLAAPLILPLTAAASAEADGGVKLLIVQERAAAAEGGQLYAPGLEALGVRAGEAAFVRVADGGEALRVTDEALKRGAARVVVTELRRGASLADLAATRRLNLSAQRQGLFLFLLTPDLEATSAALTRWRIASAPSRGPPGRLGPPAFHLTLMRNRLGPPGAWACEWSLRERRFTSAVPLAAPLHAASVHRPAAARTA